jgi:transposase
MRQPRGSTSFTFDLSRPLSQEQARAIYDQGKEAVIFALMTLSAQAAPSADLSRGVSVHQPSGMIPPYEKPSRRGGRKKPGAKKGHRGARRRSPEITHRKEHAPLNHCPDCGTALGEPAAHRSRIIEDIIETRPEAVEHTIPRHWCSKCKKMVEPPVEEALPGATFGHRLIALSAWLHYGLGVTLSQILAIFGYHLQFKLSRGGLMAAWHKLADLLAGWYDQIGEEVQNAGVLHADETGWRLSGKTVWLWCFTCTEATYYLFDRSRGSPALSKFFTEAFDGILVTDFWAAYNSVSCFDHQACLAHLFREIGKVSEHHRSPEWSLFARKLGRLLKDAIRLSKREDLNDEQFCSKRTRLKKRLDHLASWPSRDAQVIRIVKRLARYRDSILTFLYDEEVPPDNNHAEREIRPAVIIRKNSHGNRSENGARTQAILMSVYRTLKMRGHQPLETIVDALKTYVRTGNIPPLPSPANSIG